MADETEQDPVEQGVDEIDVEIKGLVPSFVVTGLVEKSLPQTVNEFRERAEKGAKKRAKKSTSSRET